MSEKSYPASNCTHKDTVIKIVIRDVHRHDVKIITCFTVQILKYLQVLCLWQLFYIHFAVLMLFLL